MEGTSNNQHSLSTTTTSASSGRSRSWHGHRDVASDKDLYGSSQELMNHSLQLRNHILTVQLVQSKKEWEALQKTFRANTHARFVYQTTLARIVAHVQDFGNRDDPAIESLLRQLIEWMEACEHIACSDTASEATEQVTRSSIKTISSNNSSNKSNRTPIFDYDDVQPFVDTSTVIPSRWDDTHLPNDSLQEQNVAMEKEIQKWQQSMARIRVCNQREVSELLCHQKTLRKVVERIQQESNFTHQQDIVEWYEYCQREAERCRSFSEQNAAKLLLLCKQCNSGVSLSDEDDDRHDDGNHADEGNNSTQECIEDDPNEQGVMRVVHDTPKDLPRPETPTTSTVATSSFDGISTSLQMLPQQQSHHHPTAQMQFAATNHFDDPPDRTFPPKATNIQGSSLEKIQQPPLAHTLCSSRKCILM